MKPQEINDSDENTAMGLDSGYQENYQKVLKQSFGDIFQPFTSDLVGCEQYLKIQQFFRN